MDNLLIGKLDDNGFADAIFFRMKDNELVITNTDDETLMTFYKEEIDDVIKVLELSKKYFK